MGAHSASISRNQAENPRTQVPRGEGVSGAQSSIAVFSTDAPGADKNMVSEVFGAGTRTQMDMLHVYKLIFEALHGHPERKVLMRQLRQQAVQYVDADVVLCAERLIESKKLHEEKNASVPQDKKKNKPKGIARMPDQGTMSDDEYLTLICKHTTNHYHTYQEEIRTSVHNPEELSKRWKAVVRTMRQMQPNLFKPTFDSVFNSIIQRIELGFLDDKVFPILYVNIGTEKRPRYRVARGTSQLEALHAAIRKSFVSASCSIDTLLNQMFLFTISTNARVGRLVRRLLIGEYSLDFELMNDIKWRMEKLKEVGVTFLGEKKHILRDWRLLNKCDPAVDWYMQASAMGSANDALSPHASLLALQKELQKDGVKLKQHSTQGSDVDDNAISNLSSNYFHRCEEVVFLAMLLSGKYDKSGALQRALEGHSEKLTVLRLLLPSGRGKGAHKCIISKINFKQLALDFNRAVIVGMMANR
jgi:hypothetical protein